MSTLTAPSLDRSLETFHLLIAEDDDSLREILAETLKSPQRFIQTCKDGTEALQAMRKSAFDLVITDLLMAGADGLEVLKATKLRNRDSVVIIMTGYASLDSAIQAIRGGAYDYIRKPFKLDEMEIVVNNAVEKLSLTRENKRLLRRLQENMEEMESLRQAWNDKILEFVEKSDLPLHSGFSEVDVTLKQVPPDFDWMKKISREKALEKLERLIGLKKEGHIDENEFFLLKRAMLKKMSD